MRFKFPNIKPRYKFHQYLELVGLAIVLLATTFQLSIQNSINDVVNTSYLYKMDTKLNLLWWEIHDMPDKNKNYTGLQSNREKEWGEMMQDDKNLKKQKNFSDNAYMYIMVFGSILLFYGRLFEIEESRKRNHT